MDLNDAVYSFVPGKGLTIPEDALPICEVRDRLSYVARNIMPVSTVQNNLTAKLLYTYLCIPPPSPPHKKILLPNIISKIGSLLHNIIYKFTYNFASTLINLNSDYSILTLYKS